MYRQDALYSGMTNVGKSLFPDSTITRGSEPERVSNPLNPLYVETQTKKEGCLCEGISMLDDLYNLEGVGKHVW